MRRSLKTHRGGLAGQLKQLGDEALRDLGGQLQAGGVRLPHKALPVDGPLLAGHQVAQIEVQVAAVLLPGHGERQTTSSTGQRVHCSPLADTVQPCQSLSSRIAIYSHRLLKATANAADQGNTGLRSSPLGHAKLFCCDFEGCLIDNHFYIIPSIRMCHLCHVSSGLQSAAKMSDTGLLLGGGPIVTCTGEL